MEKSRSSRCGPTDVWHCFRSRGFTRSNSCSNRSAETLGSYERKSSSLPPDIRKFGSQGQQRTSALSLKLSEIELVRKSIHDTPVLLLDDVLSELDSNRQNYLLNSICDTQTIITCTGLDEFIRNRFEINKVFEVISGQVFEKGQVIERQG